MRTEARLRPLSFQLLLAGAFGLTAACSNEPDPDGGGSDTGGPGTGGSASGIGDPSVGTGGATTGSGGANGTTGGAGGAGTGGANGAGGSPAGTCGGEPLLPEPESFDCGELGHVFENAGPAENRVNYIIVGDGYTEETLETLFIEHVENYLYHEQTGQFSALGEPYGRYRKFVNICGLLLPSNDNCIDNADIGRSCDTPFDGRCVPGCGSGGTRLGSVDRNKVNAAVATALPASVDVDFSAATLNGDEDGWWNSGGPIMVWNGAFGNRVNAASVALHEGGHTFHRLADEYDGTSGNCGEFDEINSTADPDAEKWEQWLGYDDARTDDRPRPGNQSANPYGTREQGAFEGSRYCGSGQYRPSEHSEMNLLPRPWNMPSAEKIILDIYGIVDPIDAHTDNSAPLVSPASLQVQVVDPEVIQIDWSVDDVVVSENGGACFVVPELTSGAHTITARAYDDTPWVRRNQELLEQTVTWQVTIP